SANSGTRSDVWNQPCSAISRRRCHWYPIFSIIGRPTVPRDGSASPGLTAGCGIRPNLDPAVTLIQQVLAEQPHRHFVVACRGDGDGTFTRTQEGHPRLALRGRPFATDTSW